MFNLQNNLKEWISLGLISSEQANRIREHQSKKSENSSWVLMSVLILGVVIVGIGLISEIASNWETIPPVVKLAADFLSLIVTAVWAFWAWTSKKTIQYEMLLLFFLILCLASVGLISQIYHTGGDFHQALLLWSLITVVAAFSARNMFVPFLWMGAFLTGIVGTIFCSDLLQSVFHGNFYAIAMTVPLLCAAFALAASLVGELNITRMFQFCTIISGSLALGCLNPFYMHFSHWFKIGTLTLNSYLIGYLLAAFTAFVICLSQDYRKVQKLILLLTLGFFLIAFYCPFNFNQHTIYVSVYISICTILVLGCMAIFFGSLKKRRLFQGCLFFIGVKFLTLYFLAFGGMGRTGIMLIISGSFIIVTILVWNKYRTTLSVLAEKLLS